MKIGKILLLLGLLARFCYAEEILEAVDKQADPSNLTNPYSFVGGGIGSYVDGSLASEFGGGLAKELSFDNRIFIGADYENISGDKSIIAGKWGQYFAVGDDSLPQIGYELEYQQALESIGESDEKLLGRLLVNVAMRFDLGVSFARIFWDLGYNVYFPKLPDLCGCEVMQGVYAGLAFNFLLDKNLSYYTLKTSYSYAKDSSGDDLSWWQITNEFGTPVDAHNQAWLKFSYSYQDGEMQYDNAGIMRTRKVGATTSNHLLKLGFDYYFL